LILSGTGVMHVDDETEHVKPGDVILIPANAVQWLENTGTMELHFIAIVNPP
jgi:mannose-6-phosphate isomerase-like protein (cupin superfamily)